MARVGDGLGHAPQQPPRRGVRREMRGNGYGSGAEKVATHTHTGDRGRRGWRWEEAGLLHGGWGLADGCCCCCPLFMGSMLVGLVGVGDEDGWMRPSLPGREPRAGRQTDRHTHTHTPARQKTKKDLVVCVPAGAANAGAQYRRARPSYGWLRSTRLAHGILSRSSITGVRRWEAPGHSQARRGWSWNRGDECPGRVLQLPPCSSGSGSIACACVLSVLGSQ